MVNQQPDGFGQQQWFPQLPEGYTGNNQPNQSFHAQGGGGSHGHGGYRPGQGGFPGQGFPPGQGGFPGHGFPPGQGGFPGHGFPPGQGGFPGQGFPPGQGGFPGQGFPPGQGGFPGQGGQHGGQQNVQAPTSAPPNFEPEYPSYQTFAVDPGAIRGCLFRYTYVWTSRRQGFWFYPTFVGRTSVAGYRWRSRQRRWEYFGIDLNNIDRFRCS